MNNQRQDYNFKGTIIILSAKVVVTVAEKYLGKGHHIYADRFYSSVHLVNELHKKDT